jgi:Tol biopolymer transport system component
MTIAKGVSVGPYEIVSPIGAGGMGEVWRARDRRIGRDVAIKVLPEEFNEEAVKRFEQEARAAGALNHPGLVTIYDVGTADHSPYIVMELLEGRTLREVLGDEVPTALPLRKALDYTAQIAAALAVAHEKGIIHRDLKPENLFITSDRRVKILDFGLAKLAADAKDAEGRARTPKNLTAAGIAIGTPAYMSPEQVRADRVDHRTDIFSLGTVLYEMLCGKPAFEMFSAVETMHAVLNVEPAPIESLVPEISQALATIVHHCLEKDPRERFQSTRDLAFQLRMLPEMQRSMTGTQLVPVGRKVPFRVGFVVIPLVLAAAIGGFVLRGIRGGGGSQAGPRTYKQLTFADGLEIFPTLAPDGKSFAYVSSQSGNRDIYVQRVDGRTAINITNDSQADDSEPSFSPDGSQIAFRSERDGGGIFLMGVTGESVRRLTNEGHNPSWAPDGKRIAYSTAPTELKPNSHTRDGELWIVDAGSGAKKKIFSRDAKTTVNSDALQPSWSPHGKRIAFWGVISNGSAQRDLWTIDPDAPQPAQTLARVTSDEALDWNPVWSPAGTYLYFGSDRDSTLNLWRVAIDEESGQPAKAPEPLSLPAAISSNFAFSQHGEVMFTAVTRFFRVVALPFDPATGKTDAPQQLFSGSQEITSFEPSPDRQTIAFTTGAMQEDVYVANADGTRVRQLTNDAARDRAVTWAPDGKTLYFYSNRGGGYDLWTIHSDGSGLSRVTKHGEVYTTDVSPDGRTLAARTSTKTVLIHLDRPIATRLEPLDVSLAEPQWSPDGKQLLGVANRHIAVYTVATRQLVPLVEGGVSPQWLPDGKHVVFFREQQIMVVDVDSRAVTASALPATVSADFDDRSVRPRLSKDGSTIYVRQSLEQSDIWMMRLEKE